jgi:sec-independent protein translocase protein TatA
MSPVLGSILGMFGGDGMILIVLALLLFYGRNLPSVGRSLGKGISEFKKGLKGLEDDVAGPPGPTTTTRTETPQIEAPRPPQRIGAPVPKFESQPADAPQPPPA